MHPLLCLRNIVGRHRLMNQHDTVLRPDARVPVHLAARLEDIRAWPEFAHFTGFGKGVSPYSGQIDAMIIARVCMIGGPPSRRET